MRKTIPAHTEILCDICKDYNGGFTRKGFLDLQCDSPKDYQGNCYDGGQKLDLCDICLKDIEQEIAHMQESRQKGKK